MANKVTFTTQGDTTIAEFDYDDLDDIESKATKAKISSEGGVTNREFPDTWPVSSSYTTKQFCDVVNGDETAVQGMSYLGEVMFSDLPASISNAEIVVEIMDGTGTSGKVIHLILTSGNVKPYRWEYTYWSDGANVSGWIAFETTANKVTSISAQSTDTEYPSAKCVYDLVGNVETLLAAI